MFGGYRFFRYLGADLSYLDFGRADTTILGVDLAAEITGWNLRAVGRLPLGCWELFGGLAIVRWDGGFYASDGTRPITTSDSGTEPSGGGAGSFAITRALRVRGEIEVFSISEREENNAGLLSSGIEYRF